MRAAGCWPNAEQALLLHAALDPAPRALQAWEQWNRRHDLEADAIDPGSLRLLPLVYRNLRDAAARPSRMPQLESVYKRSWYENQLNFHACAQVVDSLRATGIEPLLLKGCPLAIRYYPGIGARPMSDIDLLVPVDQALAAAALLTGEGWQAAAAEPLAASTLSHLHARAFRHARGPELDLHWHALHFCLDEQFSARLRADSVPLQHEHLSARTLCSADQLLCICMHGLLWSAAPSLRWIADAMLVIRSREHPVEWQRLPTMAAACRGSLQVHAALSYLRNHFDAAVPADTLEALAGAPSTRVERELFAAMTGTGHWRNARLLWLGFRANQEQRHGPAWDLPRFLEHLRINSQRRTNWQALRWAGARALARLRMARANEGSGQA